MSTNVYIRGAVFVVGDRVEKVGGDYHFKGIVVSVFRKESTMAGPGPIRLVVQNADGILHIYSEKNLVRAVV